MFTLRRHTEPVYSIAFSPCGQYLASGSFDRQTALWSLKDGQLVKTYRGGGGIFELSWSKDGSRLGVCYSDHNLVVLDTRL